MQASDTNSEILKKLGFAIATPIALLLHGLLILIPMTPQQKAKEPEKKEPELQAMGSIAELPPNVIPPTPTPKPINSPPPIVQQQPQPQAVQATIVQPQQTKSQQAEPSQQPKPSPSPVVAASTTPEKPIQPPLRQDPVPEILPDPIKEAGGKPCPGSLKSCYDGPVQSQVIEALAKKYQGQISDIYENDDPNEGYKLGFQVTNSKTKEKKYFYPVSGTRIQELSTRITSQNELREEFLRLGFVKKQPM
jgi:hypothetical protein